MASSTWFRAAGTAAVLILMVGTARSQATVYGSSCAGASGIPPTIGATGEPVIGNSFTLDINGQPNLPGLIILGLSDSTWSGFPLPLELSGFGLPGCFLNASFDFQVPFFLDGSGQFSAPVSTGTSGISFYLQAFVADFSFPTIFGALTEGLEIKPKPPTSAGKGEIVITEIMINPMATIDVVGEWIELYNTTASPIDIEGWRMSDALLDLYIFINNGNGIIVPPESYFVIAVEEDSALNGGVTVDHEYVNMLLKNSGDLILLRDDTNAIQDRVNYTSTTWPLGPQANGAAIGLDPTVPINSFFNDDPNNWCPQVSALSGGDKGTPGAQNDACP